ncbi:Tn3 family transposase, partial [Klebsiella pneumoniae]|nr:Tn3 family transposase [Klebsiella pneumoniae]
TAVLSPFLPKNFHNQPLAARSAKQRIAQSLHGQYWFREPSLLRRVQAGLNKGEARNALARAVFIRRLGEIRERG